MAFYRTRLPSAMLILLAALCAAPASGQPALPAPPSTTRVDELNQEEPRVVTANRASIGAGVQPLLTPELPVEHHPWARFQPGAWRRIRIISETFDPSGRFVGRSVTTQTEILKDIGPSTLTLESSTVIEIGGKRLQGASQTVTRPLLCAQACRAVLAVKLDPANISLDGASIPVSRWRLEYGVDGDQRNEVVYYSPDRSPYVLRREVSAVDPNSGEELEVSTTSVTRVDAPLVLQGAIVPSAQLEIVSQVGANQTTRVETHSDTVPGGLVLASSTERDASGRRVRWSAIELEDYGLAGDDAADSEPLRRGWRPFQRLRERKAALANEVESAGGA